MGANNENSEYAGSLGGGLLAHVSDCGEYISKLSASEQDPARAFVAYLFADGEGESRLPPVKFERRQGVLRELLNLLESVMFHMSRLSMKDYADARNTIEDLLGLKRGKSGGTPKADSAARHIPEHGDKLPSDLVFISEASTLMDLLYLRLHGAAPLKRKYFYKKLRDLNAELRAETRSKGSP